jgi:disulfide bond formation protein DsbB
MQEQLLKLISFGAIIILFFNTAFILIESFKFKNPIKDFISKYQLNIIFIFSLASVLGSILLSVYFKLPPCELCWYQRVFLFTIPIVALIGVYKKDIQARTYVFVLASIGTAISAYHSLIQNNLFKSDSVFCNPNGGVDCAIPAFTYFGFVTIPVIAFATFTLLLILSYAYSQKQS